MFVVFVFAGIVLLACLAGAGLIFTAESVAEGSDHTLSANDGAKLAQAE